MHSVCDMACGHGFDKKIWHAQLCEYVRNWNWVEAHKAGAVDTWTDGRRNAGAEGDGNGSNGSALPGKGARKIVGDQPHSVARLIQGRSGRSVHGPARIEREACIHHDAYSGPCGGAGVRIYVRTFPAGAIARSFRFAINASFRLFCVSGTCHPAKGRAAYDEAALTEPQPTPEPLAWLQGTMKESMQPNPAPTPTDPASEQQTKPKETQSATVPDWVHDTPGYEYQMAV